MSAATPGRATAADAGVAAAVLVAECAGDDSHLVVAVYVDPARAEVLRSAVRELVDGDGMWCGAASATPRCRDGLIKAVTSGAVSAVVIDAVGFDDPAQARAACLHAVAVDADDAGVDRVLLARDDTHTGQDTAGAAALARRAGASPTLECAHADVDTEPLIVLAEVVVWSWTQGGTYRRAMAPALTLVHHV